MKQFMMTVMILALVALGYGLLGLGLSLLTVKIGCYIVGAALGVGLFVANELSRLENE